MRCEREIFFYGLMTAGLFASIIGIRYAYEALGQQATINARLQEPIRWVEPGERPTPTIPEYIDEKPEWQRPIQWDRPKKR